MGPGRTQAMRGAVLRKTRIAFSWGDFPWCTGPICGTGRGAAHVVDDTISPSIARFSVAFPPADFECRVTERRSHERNFQAVLRDRGALECQRQPPRLRNGPSTSPARASHTKVGTTMSMW